jgi:high-affinity nickel permease
MKKKPIKRKKTKPYLPEDKINTAEEPSSFYQARLLQPHLMVIDFTYSRFKKVYDMAPFSFKDWAGFLHLSERTLLRYASENKSFEGIYIERILMLERLFKKGIEVFATPDAFFTWLIKPKKVMGYVLDKSALSSTEGILALEDELGRIEHGIYI